MICPSKTSCCIYFHTQCFISAYDTLAWQAAVNLRKGGLNGWKISEPGPERSWKLGPLIVEKEAVDRMWKQPSGFKRLHSKIDSTTVLRELKASALRIVERRIVFCRMELAWLVPSAAEQKPQVLVAWSDLPIAGPRPIVSRSGVRSPYKPHF